MAIDHLRRITNGRKMGVVCLYCDYRDQNNQTALNLIGGLVRQLLRQTRTVPNGILEIFEEKARQAITTEDAKQIFILILREFESVFICIDALDECSTEARKDLLQSFDIPNQAGLHVFLTGRHNVEVEVTKSFAKLSPKSVKVAAREEDIRICLAQKIALDPDPEAMDEKLKAEIIEKIVSLSSGM